MPEITIPRDTTPEVLKNTFNKLGKYLEEEAIELRTWQIDHLEEVRNRISAYKRLFKDSKNWKLPNNSAILDYLPLFNRETYVGVPLFVPIVTMDGKFDRKNSYMYGPPVRTTPYSVIVTLEQSSIFVTLNQKAYEELGNPKKLRAWASPFRNICILPYPNRQNLDPIQLYAGPLYETA